MGAAGDNISLSVSATGSEGDFALGLFGPPNFDSIGSVFQDSEILNVNLEADGIHVIGVLDFEAGTSAYALTLTKN